MAFAVFSFDIERKMLASRKVYPLEGDTDSLVLDAIVVTDREPAFTEFRIPLNALQKFANWNHCDVAAYVFIPPGQCFGDRAECVSQRNAMLSPVVSTTLTGA